MTERRHRRNLRLVLLACGIAVLVIVFWPTPVDRPISGTLSHVLADLHRAGLPAWFDYSLVEHLANVALFVPLGMLVALELMQALWWVSGVMGLTLSLSVEFCQYVFLPHRYASAGDLAMNTIGAVVGGAIVALVRAVKARRRYGRPSPR
jgi:VanZ family protein